MTSLRARLAAVWVLSLAAACGVGLLLVQLYNLSSTAQLARADAALADGCERIAERYGYYTAGWATAAQPPLDDELRRDLGAVVAMALAGSPGVAGGIWHGEAGALTGQDGSPGRQARVQALAEAALQSGQPETARVSEGGRTLLLHACPLRGPIADLAGFTATEVAATTGWDTLRLGLGVLLALVLALSGALTWLVLAWTRHIARIERALASAGADDLPQIAATGEAELDRIVAALNTAGARLAEARRRGADLSARVAAAERLAALGRVAAGVAHEIRNPMAAMRLRAENALAGDAARREAALHAILAQIARLDRLVAELLTMTQRREPSPEPVDLAAFCHAAAADHPGGRIDVSAPAAAVLLDPALLRRAVNALLDNALRHTPEGGRVALRATHDGRALRLEVRDSGAGVAEALRRNLFEPFVTGRAEGTGLGLAIARELAEAQGGSLTLADPGGASAGHGAVFVLEVPCPPS